MLADTPARAATSSWRRPRRMRIARNAAPTRWSDMPHSLITATYQLLTRRFATGARLAGLDVRGSNSSVNTSTGTRADWLLFVLLGFFWGSSYLFIKIGVDAGIAPFTLVTLRLLVGALLLAAVVFAAKETLPRDAEDRTATSSCSASSACRSPSCSSPSPSSRSTRRWQRS